MSLLTHKWLTAIGIPLSLILCGAVIKKLVRGDGWKFDDFCFGIELVFAALTTSMLHLLDTFRGPAAVAIAGQLPVAGQNGASASSFLAISFVALLIVMAIHQDYSKQIQPSRLRSVLMLGVSNSAGVLLFVIFHLLIKP